MNEIEFHFLYWSFIIYLVFILFTLLISIFGYIIFYFLQKANKSRWSLNYLEKFVLSFAIGLSVYISLSFILDLFQFFNFYSAYLSIIIINSVFISFLIYKKKLKKETIINFFSSIKNKIKLNPKTIFILILIISFSLILQFWIQWTIIIDEYALPSKDTYVWLGQSWYLLENGYLLRDHMPLHYPKGYTFFIASPELIYPDNQLAYYYFKFGGLCLFSLYLFVLFIILKDIFKKTYLVLIGLLFAILSNLLFSRFIFFTSSSLPTLIILISLIIILKKCPFYLMGFFISLIFLTNAFFAFFYVIALCYILIIKFFKATNNKKRILTDFVLKTFLLTLILLIPYIINISIVKNITIFDIVGVYFNIFTATLGINPYYILPQLNLFNIPTIFLTNIIEILAPHNDIAYIYLDIEKKAFSNFIIFTLIIFFIPTRKYFKSEFRDLINLGKILIVILLIFYIAEIFLANSSNTFAYNIGWFKWRILEGITGHLIIVTLFIIEKVVNISKKLTSFIKNKSEKYNRLLKNKYISKFIRIEYIVMTILLISCFSTIFVHKNIYVSTYFEKDQIDSIFYIKRHVPDDSKILVSDFHDGINSLYDLLSTYKVYLWDFEFSENSFNETIDYIVKKNIDYILLDFTMINYTELSYFSGYRDFDNIYENDINIIFRVEIES